MNTFSFKFQCPHCEQRIECEAEQAAREIECPACEQLLSIPQPPTLDGRVEMGTTSSRAVRPRDWLAYILLGAMLGALTGSGISLLQSPPMFLREDELWPRESNLMLEWIHAICFRSVLSIWGVLGAIVGGVWARQRFIKRLALALPGVAPQTLLAAEHNFSAPSSFVLAVGSWLLLILTWGWVMTQPPEAFHDQGGMVFTFIVIPLGLISWFVGGPVALALGQRGLNRARPNKTHDCWLASTGIVLSRLMLWGIALLMLLIFSQGNW